MFDTALKKYVTLNKISTLGGVVLMGGDKDLRIPLCELKESFKIADTLYNRSFENLSVLDAEKLYEACVAPLEPETIILHIGETDIDLFAKDETMFANKYAHLIATIKAHDKKCHIAIVSLLNPNNHAAITEMNKQLKYISDSERCEFVDLSFNKNWNPKASMETSSFLHSMGFVRPLKAKHPVYNLVRAIYFAEA